MYEMNKKRQACLVAVAASACIGSPAWAQSTSAAEVRQALPAMQVVRDPVTGLFRAPTHEEVAAQSAAASAVSARQRKAGGGTATMSSVLGANHALVRRSEATTAAPVARMGSVVKRGDLSKMHFTMATRDANGRLEATCVAGESAAEHALHAGVKPAKGEHDEQ